MALVNETPFRFKLSLQVLLLQLCLFSPSAGSNDGIMLEVFSTLQDTLQTLHDDLDNSIQDDELHDGLLMLTDIAEDLLSLSAENSDAGGQSAALTAEDTTVDIMKTIEDILQYFEDDPDVADNNPEDLEAIVDIVEEILTYLDGDGTSEGKATTKKKTTTEEPEEETKKPKKKPNKNDDDEEEDYKPKKKNTTPSDDEEEKTTKRKTTTTEEPETTKEKTTTTTPTTQSSAGKDDTKQGKGKPGSNADKDEEDDE